MPQPIPEPSEIEIRTGATASDPAEDLLAECLARPEPERTSAIEAACARRPDLAAELQMRVAALRAMGIELGETRGFPEQLGDFRLIERLGGGGMGVVYLAVQTSLQRDVALKLIRPEHMYFAGARARFRREAEAVARLEHPGIVPIFAVGEDQGVPYFAMELVRGSTLAEALRALRERAPESLRGADLHAVVAAAARSRSVSDDPLPEGSLFDGTWIQACLRITRAVADALQHAHERGLVHRDVKPSNIALSPDGRVRLFDFGLTSAAGASEMTKTGSALGTLHYMSPEQLRRAGAADARSDVYSLGIALYEMLALQLPYRGDDALEVQRLVIDGRADPIRPRNRRVEAELETVVLHAIDRDPQRRYASAADFARDLGHLLAHRPIEARRPGVLLLARRWMQRHPVAATALVVAPALALGAGSVMLAQERAHSRQLGTTLDEVRVARDLAQSEGERARSEADTAQHALDYVVGLFTPTSRVEADDKSTTVHDVLAHGAAGVEEKLRGDPRAQARMYTVLGRLFRDRGAEARALELYERALALWRTQPEREIAPYLAETLTCLGEALHTSGRGTEASMLLREALALWPEGQAGERGRQRCLQGLLMLGAPFVADSSLEARARRALEAELSRPEPQVREVAHLRNELGSALLSQRKYDEAALVLQQAYDAVAPGAAGTFDPGSGSMLSNLALARGGQGRLDEAIALSVKALEIRRSHSPGDRKTIGIMLLNLAGLEDERKNHRAAVEFARESVEVLSAALTPRHPVTLNAQARLARYGVALGECEEADEAACAVIAARTSLPADDPTPGRAWFALAACAEKRGDPGSAEELWRQAVAALSECPGYWLEHASALSNLGRVRLEAGSIAEADVLLGKAYEIVLSTPGKVPRPLLENLARVSRAAGREDAARAYESRLEE